MFWNDPQARRRKQRLEWRDRYEGLLREIIGTAMERGDIGTVDVTLAGHFVASSLNWLPRWYNPDGALTASEIAERFYDMAVNGLQARRD